jgi:predicted XRE-type DNA-binding protein
MNSIDEARKVLCRNVTKYLPAMSRYIDSIAEVLYISRDTVERVTGKKIRDFNELRKTVARSQTVKNYIESLIGPCEEIG